MQPTNRKEIWAILTSEPVSAVLIALIVIVLLCLSSRAHGGQPCAQRVVRKNVKAQTVFVPYNYGHRNALVEVPADAVFSEVYAYKYALPIQTFEPVKYTAAPPGHGIAQPRLIERVIERYSDEPAEPLVEEVVAEEVEEPEHCPPPQQVQSQCKPAQLKAPHPGAVVGKQQCATCHTGKKAEAANRPAFWDNSGKFTANAAQKSKMLTAAHNGTMPPKGELTNRDYLALADWLDPQQQVDPSQVKQTSDIEARLLRLEQENESLKAAINRPAVSIGSSPWSTGPAKE
jgi:hypothetical protein